MDLLSNPLVLNELEQFLGGKQINEQIVLKSLTKLMFFVLKQISDIHPLFLNMKTQMDNLSNQLNSNNQSLQNIDAELNNKISLINNSFNLIQDIVTEDLTFEPDIFKACTTGKLTSVRYLIEKLNINPNQIVEQAQPDINIYEGETPIHIAVKNVHLPIVQYLIEKQNIDKESKGQDEKTPLHYACEVDNLPIIEYLISNGAKMLTKDINGKSSYDYIISNQQQDIIEDIHSKYNFPLDFEQDIFKASREGKLESVQWLIEKEGVDKNKKDGPLYSCRNAPIHYASMNGHISIVKYLIENQNVDVDLKGTSEKTPLHYACKEGHLPLVQYLISKGANIEQQSEIFEDEEDNFRTVSYGIYHFTTTEYYGGYTPLHLAAESGKTDVVKYLVSVGANIKSVTADGFTPRYYAKNNEIRNLLTKK